MLNLIIIFLISQNPVEIIDSIQVGLKFESPEECLESYWQTMNEQDLEKLALHFSYVTVSDAPEIAAAIWPCGVKNYGIEFFEKTILNDTLIHLKYYVKLEKKKFKSGDLMVYSPYFGWRILAPCTDPPKLDELIK
jgi:hypothetical protein